jgi:hypothetical protein
LDLAEILSDAIADKKMTSKIPAVSLASLTAVDITWIIIILIIISIFVTCSEVFLRFGLLSGSKNKTPGESVFSADTSDTHGLNYTSATRAITRFGLVMSWILFGTSLL